MCWGNGVKSFLMSHAGEYLAGRSALRALRHIRDLQML